MLLEIILNRGILEYSLKPLPWLVIIFFLLVIIETNENNWSLGRMNEISDLLYAQLAWYDLEDLLEQLRLTRAPLYREIQKLLKRNRRIERKEKNKK